MEKFRTINQMKNILKEDGYKFLYTDKDDIDIYRDYDGSRAYVDLKNKTIDYKGFREEWV